MIIVIDKIDEALTDNDKIRAIENILRAFGEGKHVVWMPSDIANQLISSGKFANYSLRILYELKDRSRLTKSLLRDFEFHLHITFDDAEILEFAEPDKMIAGFKRVIDSGHLQETTFIAENLSDAYIYEHGSKSFLILKKLYGEYDIKFRQLNGGGNTTIDVFKKELEDERFLLCLLDSDKKHPKGKLGDTAARFNDIKHGYGEGYYLEVLECTELENLMPYKLVKEVISRYKAETLDGFEKVTSDLRKYSDHKKGLTIQDALTLDETHKHPHWAKLIEGLDLTDGIICPALGDNLLSHCIDFLKTESLHKSCEFIDSNLDAEWINISKRVASWGIGLKRGIR